jgi:hypothetical protein
LSFSGNQYPDFASKVITTRGDIVRGSSTGARERLGLGSANQVLQSDGTDIDWETLALADSTLTTQGDILYQNASGLARLGQSTDGYVLTTKGAAANPVWAATSGGATVARTVITSNTAQSVTSTSYVDLTDFTRTTSGTVIAITQYTTVVDGAQNASWRWSYSLTGDQANMFCNDNNTTQHNYGVTDSQTDQVVKMQLKLNGAGSINVQDSSKTGAMYVTEIS